MLKLQIIGNIGSDAEKKASKSGREYLQFNVAHDRGKDKPSTWVRVFWFEGVNSFIEPYLKKGAKVAVIGNVSVEAYTANNGAPSVGITLYPDSVDIVLYPKREDGSQDASQQQPAAPAGAQHPAQAQAPGYRPNVQPTDPYDGGEWGPGVPDYDRAPDFLKDQGDDMP